MKRKQRFYNEYELQQLIKDNITYYNLIISQGVKYDFNPKNGGTLNKLSLETYSTIRFSAGCFIKKCLMNGTSNFFGNDDIVVEDCTVFLSNNNRYDNDKGAVISLNNGVIKKLHLNEYIILKLDISTETIDYLSCDKNSILIFEFIGRPIPKKIEIKYLELSADACIKLKCGDDKYSPEITLLKLSKDASMTEFNNLVLSIDINSMYIDLTGNSDNIE
jgi:hypothetical protein